MLWVSSRMTPSLATIVVAHRAHAQRPFRTCGRSAAWIVSLAVHVAILAALGIAIPHLPQGSAGGGGKAGGSGIVLTAQFSAKSPSYLQEAATSRLVLVNAAPALLAFPMHPLPVPASQPRPSEIALTSATVASPVQPLPQFATADSAIRPSSAGATGGGPGQTQLFGVTGQGTRFVYVFDRSASMEGVRLATAKHELIASLNALESRHQFQVVFYSQRPEAMPFDRGGRSRMVAADARSKLQAESFIRGVIADGPTYHLPALEMALGLAPDVIFFLTDADEPQMTSSELAKIRHSNRGTVINTIEFGAGPSSANYNFLQQLAAENNGQHGYVDVNRFVR